MNLTRQISDKVMVHSIGFFVFLQIQFFTAVFITNGVYAQDLIEKLPSLSSSRVQIIENQPFCSVGLGTQHTSFLIEGERVYSRKLNSAYEPGFDILNSPFIRVDCSINKIVGGYSFYESSILFDRDITYKDTAYNVADFKNNNLYIGYSFTLIAHILYVDTGLGYSQTQYRLDYVSNGSLRGNPETLDGSGSFGFLNLKWFINDFLYLHWLNQQAFQESNAVVYANQLGFNFLVRL